MENRMQKNIKKDIEDQLKDIKGKEYDIVLGMSGGVDSTYSLLSFLNEGKKVLGVYLDLFEDENDTSLKNAEKAKKLAKKYNIDFKIIDAKKYFKEKVQGYFVNTYVKGATPNPCSICNRDVKIAVLYEISEIIKAKNIATGHYAGISTFKDYKIIKKGKEPKKEQSYFLALIPSVFLEKLVFPLEKVEDKETIRKYLIDEKIMSGKSSSDSQDICFLKNGKHEEFCIDYLNEEQKDIKELNAKLYTPNKKVYDGKYVFSYTVGQRKGLGVSYEKPLYVKEITEKNEIILDTKENMYEKSVKINNLNLFIPKEEIPTNILVKIRYSKNEAEANIEFDKIDESKAKIIFKEKQIKGAKGQICAIYFEDMLLGGGIIY